MRRFILLSCISAVLSIPTGSVNSKSISRSNDLGSVNLVEFSVRGVNHGQCSYRNQRGEEITLIYEEVGSELKARSSLPNTADPVAEVRSCRSAAVSPPESRSSPDVVLSNDESNLDLFSRIFNFQQKMALNQQYVSQLSPRLINFVPLATTPVATGSVIKDKFTNLFNGLNGINFGTVNVPFPVLNIPVGIQQIPFPIIVPTVQTINIPKPVIGK